jgi:hypothetical protein
MEIYTQTPQPRTKGCKILHFLLSGFLSFGTYLITLGVWFMYNWYYALSALLLAFILIGILRSKLLHSSVPKVQQEFTYSDKDIAAWYLHMYICPSEAQ